MGYSPLEQEYVDAGYGTSTTESKTNNLINRKNEKLNNLSNKTLLNVKDFTGMYDADSPYYAGIEGKSTGRVGSVQGDYGNAPEMVDRGVLSREGVNARIKSDNFLMGVGSATEDADLNPKYYDQYKNTINQSLREEVLAGNLNISGTQGYTGKYGRQVLDITRDGQSLNKDIQQRYGTRYGKPFTDVPETRQLKVDLIPDTDNRALEDIDVAQGALAKFGADMYNMTEKLVGKENIDTYNKWASNVEKTFGGDGDVGWLIGAEGDIKGTDTNIKDFRDREFAAKAFGVKQETLDEHNAAMAKGQKMWTDADTLGEYLKAMAVGASQLDRILATSAGEIAGLVLPGGPALVAATRTANFAEEYEKNNDKEMSPAKLAETFFAQLAVLIPEKLLIKSGITVMFNRSGKVTTIARDIAGEALQEYAEGITEDYATQKEGERTLAEIATAPEQTYSAAIGGTMGGTLSTAAQIPSIVAGAVDKPIDKLKAEMARRKETKQTPEQKKADKLVEEEKAATKNTIKEYLDVSGVLDAEGNDIQATQAIIKAYSMLDDVKDKQERAVYEAHITKRRESLMKKRLAERVAVIDKQDIKAIQALGSSEDAVARLKELLGAVDNLDADKVNSALTKVSKELGINMDDIVKLKTEVKAEKAALEVIRKSQIEVEGEVVSGPKGYKTYYEGLKTAKLLGDKEGIAEFTDKLEYFKGSQTRKYDKLSAAVKEVRADLMSKIERDMSARKVSRAQVLKDFLKKRFEVVPTDYSETGKPFEINPKNVLQNIINPKIRTGAYSAVDAIQSSIDAMSTLVPTTTRKVETEVKTETKVKDSTPEPTEKVVEETLPTAKEVADKIATGKELNKADLQVQDNRGAEVEKELQVLKDKITPDKSTEKEYSKAADVALEVQSIDEQASRMQGEKEVKLQEIEQLKADRKTTGKDAKESIRYELDSAYNELGSINTELRILNGNKRAVVKKLKTDKAQKLIDNSASSAEEVLEARGTPVVTDWVSLELKTALDTKTRAVKTVLDKLIDPRVTDFRVDESPFRLLMQGEGQYPVEVAEAMAIVTSSYLGERYGELRLNDDTQIAKMLGFRNGTKIPAKVRRELSKAGRLESNEAAGIGRNVLKLLGIEAKDTADYDLRARIEVDAGATALAVMEEMGLVIRDKSITVGDMARLADDVRGEATAGTVDNAGKPVAMTKIHPKVGKKWVSKAKSNKEFYEKLDEELDVGIHEKAPRYSKKRKATRHVTRNAEKWTELTKKQQKALDIAENRVHEINQESLSVLRELWGSLAKDGGKLSEKRLEVVKLFGWADPKNGHIDIRPNIEAKNREIVSSIQNLLEFAEVAGSNDVYFDYFFSKNGRFFIDSSKINPQTDKLHRFIVGVKESKKNRVVTDKTRAAFKIAVVQAFDESKVVEFEINGDGVEEIVNGENIRGLGAIDKQSQADNIKQFEEIITNGVVKEAINSPTSDNILKAIQGVDHPSHAIMAITELTKYEADKNFETKMTMETDAVTSGFTLGLLANPIMIFSKLKKWLAKGGVWFGKNEYSTYGDWRAKGKDAYEEGAEQATEKLKTTISEAPHNGWIAHIVGEIDRKFMKNPFMVFMYGAGVASIKRAISSTAVENVMDDLSNPDKVDTTLAVIVNGVSGSIKQLESVLSEAKTGKQKKGIAYAIKNKKQTLTSLEAVLKTIESRTGEQRTKAKLAVARRIKETKVDFFYITSKNLSAEQAINKNALSRMLKGVQEIVSDATRDTYGAAVAEYMNSTFSEIAEMRKAMNNMFTGMYGAFKYEFDIRLKEAQGKRAKPSKEQVDSVLEAMMKEGKIPGIMTVEAENEFEKAPIMKTDRIKARQGSQVQIKTNPQRTVHPLVYTMVANPTAGAVVNIHYLDGALIMKVISDSSGFGVHDAYVTHVNNVVEATKGYNKQVWDLTQQFNMLERVQEEFDTAIKNSSEDVVKDAIWDNYVETFGASKGEDAPTRDSMYEEAVKVVKESIIAIDRNKIKMKEQGATIAHMAGPEGSTYTVEGTESVVEEKSTTTTKNLAVEVMTKEKPIPEVKEPTKANEPVKMIDEMVEQADTKPEEAIISKDKAMVNKAKEAITRCKK